MFTVSDLLLIPITILQLQIKFIKKTLQGLLEIAQQLLRTNMRKMYANFHLFNKSRCNEQTAKNLPVCLFVLHECLMKQTVNYLPDYFMFSA